MKTYFSRPWIFALSLICFALQVLKSNAGNLPTPAPGNDWVKPAKGERIDQWYYFDGKNVYCDEMGTHQMVGVDIGSFQVWAGSKYSKDKQRVYYPIKIPCVDGIDDKGNPFGNCYCEKYTVKDADPAHFKYLGKDYATDGHSVFFRGEKVPGADGSSVQLVDGPKYLYCIKDNKRVFIYDKPLSNADPPTFFYWLTEGEDMDKGYLLRDSNMVWRLDPPNLPVPMEKWKASKGRTGETEALAVAQVFYEKKYECSAEKLNHFLTFAVVEKHDSWNVRGTLYQAILLDDAKSTISIPIGGEETLVISKNNGKIVEKIDITK